MYVPFDALLPNVLQDLYNEGVDESHFNKNRAEYALRTSYITFVKRSNAIRRTYTLTGQANVSEYYFLKYDGYVAKKLYEVKVDGTCYHPGKICTCNCCPNTYSYQDGFLNLCPAPLCDGVPIDICASVFPEAQECQMEERIYELYGDEIAKGASAKLVAKSAARFFQVEYEAGIARASSEAAKSWSKNRVQSSSRIWVRR